MPRKPLDSWVFSLLHLCAPVLPKGIIFASGALFVGAGRGPRLSSGRGITKTYNMFTEITGIANVQISVPLIRIKSSVIPKKMFQR